MWGVWLLLAGGCVMIVVCVRGLARSRGSVSARTRLAAWTQAAFGLAFILNAAVRLTHWPAAVSTGVDICSAASLVTALVLVLRLQRKPKQP